MKTNLFESESFVYVRIFINVYNYWAKDLIKNIMKQIKTPGRLAGYKKQRETRRKHNLKKHSSITKNQKLKDEYDPKNEIPAKDIPLNYPYHVKWICRDCGHKWPQSPLNRTNFYIDKTRIEKKGKISSCPLCKFKDLGKKVSAGIIKKRGNLLDKYPDLCKQWDYDRNTILPSKVSPGSNVNRFWLCLKHGSYSQAPASRTGPHKSGCPFCNTKKVSKPEFRIYSEMLTVFGEVKRNQKHFGREIDIFLPKQKFGIEIDGHYHRGKLLQDIKKNEHFKKKGIKILRIREPKLKPICSDDFNYNGKAIELKDIKNCLKIIQKRVLLSDEENKKINKYLKLTKFNNEKKYKLLIKYLPYPPREDSLATKNPEVCKTWDYEKNYPLVPEIFTIGSREKVWWTCNKKASDHPQVLKFFPDSIKYLKKHESFEQSISDRSKGRGCINCGVISRLIKQHNRVIKKNGSLFEFPEIIKEIKNSILRKKIKKFSKQIPASSKIEIEWYCKIHNHSWTTKISRRIFGRNVKKRSKGIGCKFCGWENVASKKRIDLTGKKHGLLTFLSLHKTGKEGAVKQWKVKCDGCKKIKIINFNNKEKISCGCLRKEGLSLKKFLFLQK